VSLAVLITRRILKWSIAGWMVEILLLGVRNRMVLIWLLTTISGCHLAVHELPVVTLRRNRGPSYKALRLGRRIPRCTSSYVSAHTLRLSLAFREC
jgi:hypothetical protein